MSVGLLIVTHDRIGETLLRTAKRMLGDLPLAAKALSVTIDANTEELSQEALSLLDQIDRGDGVLVLTDMYGSTPSNIAFGLMQPGHVNVISGVNLPMLIRTLNYASLDLGPLTEKAISGGKDGIFCCTQTEHA
ncbi:MAG: PTS sugar transporter subunit IIA [Candidatus Thiodiazotropha sp.]|jgi:mannose PTS system EIIA component